MVAKPIETRLRHVQFRAEGGGIVQMKLVAGV
jgi:hypothetical protein